jgi:hypothetical protein
MLSEVMNNVAILRDQLLQSFVLQALVGGISDNEKAVTPELQKELKPIEPELKAKIEEEANGPVDSIEPIAYKTQLVAGVNYFVKYQLGSSDLYFHARIYRPLSGPIRLVKVSGPKTLSDPITYF